LASVRVCQDASPHFVRHHALHDVHLRRLARVVRFLEGGHFVRARSAGFPQREAAHRRAAGIQACTQEIAAIVPAFFAVFGVQHDVLILHIIYNMSK